MTDKAMKNRILRAAGAIIVAAVFAVSFMALTPACAYAAEGYDEVAGSSEMSEVKDVGKYGMTPISGDNVKDGEYEVEMESPRVHSNSCPSSR